MLIIENPAVIVNGRTAMKSPFLVITITSFRLFVWKLKAVIGGCKIAHMKYVTVIKIYLAISLRH